MFDINTIITQALNAAVKQAVDDALRHTVFDFATPMTEMQDKIAALINQIGCLEADLAQHTTRIAALENNPAQGVDVGAPFSTDITLNAIIEALDKQEWFWEKVSRFVANNSVFNAEDLGLIKDRLGALEDADEKTIDSDDVEAMIERAMDDHCSTYNHDDYDTAAAAAEDLPDFDDFVTRGDLEDAINEALNGATVSIQV